MILLIVYIHWIRLSQSSVVVTWHFAPHGFLKLIRDSKCLAQADDNLSWDIMVKCRYKIPFFCNTYFCSSLSCLLDMSLPFCVMLPLVALCLMGPCLVYYKFLVLPCKLLKLLFECVSAFLSDDLCGRPNNNLAANSVNRLVPIKEIEWSSRRN